VPYREKGERRKGKVRQRGVLFSFQQISGPENEIIEPKLG
jgi:hypothetical protein